MKNPVSRLAKRAFYAAQFFAAASGLMAATVTQWNFNAFTNGAAITSVNGSGVSAFTLAQATSSLQPEADTSEVPPVAASVTALTVSADFDGASGQNYLTASSVQSSVNFGANTAFTFEAWFCLRSYYPNSSGQRHIFSTRGTGNQNAGFAMGVTSDVAPTNARRLFFMTDGGASQVNTVSTSEIELDQWYHVAAVRTTAGAVRLYINGVLDSQSSNSTFSLPSTAAPMLGASPHSISATPWDGYIAEVRISDEALDPEDFLHLSRWVSWTIEPMSGQSFARTVFLPTESQAMQIQLTEHNLTLSSPTLQADVFDYWGQSAGTVNVSAGPNTGEFVLTPSVGSTGWYRIELSLQDSNGAQTLRRELGDPLATETYHYLQFAVVPEPLSTTAVPSSPFGVDTAISSSANLSEAAQREMTQRTGARWARDRMRWNDTTDPQSGTGNFSRYIANANALSSAGINVLQVFQGSPSWTRAAGSGSFDYPNDLIAAYEFARDVAEAVPGATAWEIWNEMDIAHFATQTPDLYSSMLKAMALGFRAANTEPSVALGPFARDPRVSGFVDVLQANEIAQYIDTYNFHTYLPVDGGLLATGLAVHAQAQDVLGLTGRPTMISEVGALYARGSVPVPEVAKAIQVRYLFDIYMHGLASGADSIFWFLLRPSIVEGARQYGLTDSLLCPFPVYVAYAVMTNQLGAGTYLGTLAWDHGQAWLFDNGGEEVGVFVPDSTTDPIVLPAYASGAAVYDVMGNLRTIQSSGGQLTVNTGGYPFYLVDFSATPTPPPTEPDPVVLPARNPYIVLRADYPTNRIAIDTGEQLPSWDGVASNWAPRGYAHVAGETVSFDVDVYNFGASASSGSIQISVPAGYSATPSNANVTVPAGGMSTVSFSVDTPMATDAPPGLWTISGMFDGVPITPSAAKWMVDSTADPSLTDAPLPPAQVMALSSSSSASLSWLVSSGATRYRVWRATSSGGAYSLVADSNNPGTITIDGHLVTYTNSGLTNGTTYYYVVTAMNDDSQESIYSNEVSVTPDGYAAFIARYGLTNPGDGSSLADYDGDGLVTMLEYGLNLDPTVASLEHAPRVSWSNGRLVMGFRRLRGEMTYTVQASSDLVTWTDIAVDPTQGSQQVYVADNPPPGATQRFMRLRVSNSGGANRKTQPEGYIMLSIPEGPSTPILGFPLNSRPIHRGRITAFTSTTLTVAGANFTADTLDDPADPYWVRIITGNQTGRHLRISNNTTNTLLVSVTDNGTAPQVDLDESGWSVAIGDVVEIAPAETLNTFFGGVVAADSTMANADNVSYWNGNTWVPYYHDSDDGEWYNNAGNVVTNRLLQADRAPRITRRAGRPAITLPLFGVVPESSALLRHAGNGSVVSFARFPQTVLLSSHAFQGPGTWVSAATEPAADTVGLWNGSAWETYWRLTNGQWRLSGGGSTNYANEPIDAGEPTFIVRRNAASGSETFISLPPPYGDFRQ